MTEQLYGYAGQLLRVELGNGDITKLDLSPDFGHKWVGGSGFGAKFLYDQVPAGVQWDHPGNRVILASGPLGGTRVNGSGLFSVIFKGPMTNMVGATQAAGFLGAFLKFSGFDGVIVDGVAPEWCYLYIHDGQAELRDARHLLGLDTWETETAIAAELGIGERKLSVFSIGPAGEKMVRFAGLLGDKGHSASKNGLGAVLGAKKLKGLAVVRGSQRVPVYDKSRLSEAVAGLVECARTSYNGQLYELGTGGGLSGHYFLGQLPIKNLTTNEFPDYEQVDGYYLRTHYEIKAHPCWACQLAHVKMVKVTEGPYTDYEGEEPEYECIAAWGPQIGNSDLGAVVMLSNLTDRLGFDANEAGWVVGWVMECYERGILSRTDLDGLDLSWGNVEAVEQLLHKIARREGCGDWLAEGVMRASNHVGREAPDLGVYTLKGTSPRGHDHRARWEELLDTCLSNTSTIEATPSLLPDSPKSPGIGHTFSPETIVAANVASGGWRQFIDCLGVCRFCFADHVMGLEAFNAITGWDFSTEDALKVGRRVINQFRVFNFNHGLHPALEAPSPRYQSIPTDGPATGKNFAEHFDWMREAYWEKMGWDKQTGKPLPETLEQLGLSNLIPDLWPEPENRQP